MEAIVFINVFHVEPANQQRVVELLSDITENSVSRTPGFLSATLHRSSDGAKVAMYARWRSYADYDAMRGDPTTSTALTELMTIARFDPGMYEVVREFTAAAI